MRLVTMILVVTMISGCNSQPPAKQTSLAPSESPKKPAASTDVSVDGKAKPKVATDDSTRNPAAAASKQETTQPVVSKTDTEPAVGPILVPENTSPTPPTVVKKPPETEFIED